MCTAAGPDPNPIGGGQLPNPNECNQGYLPLPLYIDVDEWGHCLRLGSPLTFFPWAMTSRSRMSIMRVRESRFVPTQFQDTFPLHDNGSVQLISQDKWHHLYQKQKKGFSK